MWLRNHIQQVCIKEFALQHLHDILQVDAYIGINLQRLVSLNITSENSIVEDWLHVSSQCDFSWHSIVEYVKIFQKVFDILVQTEFFDFELVVFHIDNFNKVLQSRINFCKVFIEISRTIAYKGPLKIHFARVKKYNNIFQLLNSQCNISDPPGSKLIPLGNRVCFIRRWIEKNSYSKSEQSQCRDRV